MDAKHESKYIICLQKFNFGTRKTETQRHEFREPNREKREIPDGLESEERRVREKDLQFLADPKRP